jgi:hypothetical protein
MVNEFKKLFRLWIKEYGRATTRKKIKQLIEVIENPKAKEAIRTAAVVLEFGYIREGDTNE